MDADARFIRFCEADTLFEAITKHFSVSFSSQSTASARDSVGVWKFQIFPFSFSKQISKQHLNQTKTQTKQSLKTLIHNSKRWQLLRAPGLLQAPLRRKGKVALRCYVRYFPNSFGAAKLITSSSFHQVPKASLSVCLALKRTKPPLPRQMQDRGLSRPWHLQQDTGKSQGHGNCSAGSYLQRLAEVTAWCTDWERRA